MPSSDLMSRLELKRFSQTLCGYESVTEKAGAAHTSPGLLRTFGEN